MQPFDVPRHCSTIVNHRLAEVPIGDLAVTLSRFGALEKFAFESAAGLLDFVTGHTALDSSCEASLRRREVYFSSD